METGAPSVLPVKSSGSLNFSDFLKRFFKIASMPWRCCLMVNLQWFCLNIWKWITSKPVWSLVIMIMVVVNAQLKYMSLGRWKSREPGIWNESMCLYLGLNCNRLMIVGFGEHGLCLRYGQIRVTESGNVIVTFSSHRGSSQKGKYCVA